MLTESRLIECDLDNGLITDGALDPCKMLSAGVSSPSRFLLQCSPSGHRGVRCTHLTWAFTCHRCLRRCRGGCGPCSRAMLASPPLPLLPPSPVSAPSLLPPSPPEDSTVSGLGRDCDVGVTSWLVTMPTGTQDRCSASRRTMHQRRDLQVRSSLCAVCPPTLGCGAAAVCDSGAHAAESAPLHDRKRTGSRC